MSMIHKASFLIQTSNAMRFNYNTAPLEPTYKGVTLTGKSCIPTCFRKSQKPF